MVIEDHFAIGRLSGERIGAEIVIDVGPYEIFLTMAVGRSHVYLKQQAAQCFTEDRLDCPVSPCMVHHIWPEKRSSRPVQVTFGCSGQLTARNY